jgi:hypothetical protein
MGLDNYPKTLPCVSEYGTIETEGKGCKELAECNKCPWAKHFKDDGEDGILGIFGAPCWFRGKSGNFMIERLCDSFDDLNFYGDSSGDGSGELSPSYCETLADFLFENEYEHMDAINGYDWSSEDVQSELKAYAYAIKWLRFVAKYDGAMAWY